MKAHATRLFALLIAGTLAASANAATTRYNTFETFKNFAPGELDHVMLSDDGKLQLSRALDKNIEPDEGELIWDAIPLDKKHWVLATGHKGQLLLTDLKTTATVLAKAGKPEITALHALGERRFLFAVSPGGKVMRGEVAKDDSFTSSVFFETKQKYVWQILGDGAGGVYVATGQKGRVFHLDAAGKKLEATEFDDDNVMWMFRRAGGGLVVATQGKGRIFSIEPNKKPFALYESTENELRKVVEGKDGVLYAASNSDLLIKRPFMSGASSSKSPTPPSSSSSSISRASRGKSSVIRINRDGFVRTIWQASDAPIHDLLYDAKEDRLVVSAGQAGKLYSVDDRGRYAALLGIRESQIFRIVTAEAAGRTLLLAAGPCVVYTLGDGPAREGTYESPIIDGQSSVRWGGLNWRGLGALKCVFETRSGNTREPDGNWSEWKEAGKANGAAALRNPVARFLQWRAKFEADRKGASPILDRVELFHAAPNQAPVIAAIAVTKEVKATPSAKPPTMGAPPTPSPSSSSSPSSSEGKSTPLAAPSGSLEVDDFSNSMKYKVKWMAMDPNGDGLTAKVELRHEDDPAWLLVAEDYKKTDVILDTQPLKDGLYRARVSIDDTASNPPEEKLEAAAISDPFTIDNTPPAVDKFKAKKLQREGKATCEASFQATDARSTLAGAKYSVDGDDWIPLTPEDMVYDSREESFAFTFKIEKPDESHILMVNATDRQGNTGVSQLIVPAK